MQTINKEQISEKICPNFECSLFLLGKKWNAMILTVLLDYGSLRFTEISNYVEPCSDRVLAERLKELEAMGLIQRQTFSNSSLIEYKLTKMGVDLDKTLKSLHRWSDKWLTKV